MLKKRVEGLEKTDNGERTALFVIHLGRARGTGADGLTWDLSKPEFDTLKNELEADGFKVHTVELCIPDRDRPGEVISAWELRSEDFRISGKHYGIKHYAKETT